MDDEELKKQFFKDHSRRVATENIYSEVADLSQSLPPARSFSDLKKTTKEGQKSLRKSLIGRELNQRREKRRENSINRTKNTQMNSKTMWI